MDSETAIWQPDPCHTGWKGKREATVAEPYLGSVHNPNVLSNWLQYIQKGIGVKRLAFAHAAKPRPDVGRLDSARPQKAGRRWWMTMINAFFSLIQFEGNHDPFLNGAASSYSRSASST